MKNIYLYFIVFCFCNNVSNAQIVLNGKVTDQDDKQPISGAFVKITNNDSINSQVLAYTITNNKGEYTLEFQPTKLTVNLEFSLIGYKTKYTSIDAISSTTNHSLEKENFILNEVTIRAPNIMSKGDTINYNVSSFASKDDRNIEDLLKKLPGITVDQSGRVEYQGKPINKFYIEGLDMQGGRYSALTKNVTIDQVNTIQVYENHQPIRLLKGIEFSERAAINIQLKNRNMTRPMGNLLLGEGYSDYWIHICELFGFMANKQQQFLFTIKGNNSGDNIQNEMVNHYGSNFQSAKVGTLISNPSIGGPDLIASRSGDIENLSSSLNNIRKINDSSTLRTNIIYQREKNKNRKDVISYYYTADQEVILSELFDITNINNNILGSFTYSKNTEKLYINNTLGGFFNFGDNSMGVLSRIDHQQNYKREQINLNNILNLMWKSDNNVYSINSSITGANIPPNKLSISSSDNSHIEQLISGYSIYMKHSSSFVKGFNVNSHLIFDLSFESEHDKIKSSLENTSSNLNSKNYNKGYKLTSEILVGYSYSKNKLNLRITAPLRFYNIKYDNEISSTSFKYNKPTIAPQIQTVYKFTPNLSTNMSIGVNHHLGDIMDFITEPIQKSYNIISTGESGILSERKGWRYNLGYDYRNTIDGFFSSLSFGYSRNKKNVIKGSVISNDGNNSSFSETSTNYSNNISGSFYIAKNFHKINTTISTTTTYNYTKNEKMRQSKLVSYSNNMILINPSITYNNFDWLSVKGYGSFTFVSQTIELNNNTSTNIYNFVGGLEVSFFPLKKIEFYTTLAYHNNVLQNNMREKFYFMGTGIRYQPQKTIEIGFNSQNITNISKYTRVLYSELDRIETTYYVRPISFIFSFKLNY